jgi:hypothetical protein
MDIRKYMKNVFLKAEEVKASGPIRLTITDVSEGQFGKPNLTFHDGTKLSLNATNNRALGRAYGMESDDWLAREVELYIGEIPYGGEPQEAIRVKPMSPPIENKVPPKPEFDDTIEY